MGPGSALVKREYQCLKLMCLRTSEQSDNELSPTGRCRLFIVEGRDCGGEMDLPAFITEVIVEADGDVFYV